MLSKTIKICINKHSPLIFTKKTGESNKKVSGYDGIFVLSKNSYSLMSGKVLIKGRLNENL